MKRPIMLALSVLLSLSMVVPTFAMEEEIVVADEEVVIVEETSIEDESEEIILVEEETIDSEEILSEDNSFENNIVEEELAEAIMEEEIDSTKAGTMGQFYFEANGYKCFSYTGGEYVEIAQYIGSANAELNIPSTINGYIVFSVGSEAFKDCSWLTKITLPDSLTRIGWSAFEGCSSLTEITLPDSLTRIEGSAFRDCSGLTEIIIPNSVTSINQCAFYGCSSLTGITIPDSVTSIEEGAFGACRDLTSIRVAEGNSKYDSRNNCNAIIETASNTLLVGCKNTIILDNVTAIGYDAFDGCRGLTGITLPEGLTKIDDYAFARCSSLTGITIPSGVTTIGEGTFCDCSSLTGITIPANVTTIGEGAFYGCSGLTEITIPSHVTTIGEYAFQLCLELEKIELNNVTLGEDYELPYTYYHSDGTAITKLVAGVKYNETLAKTKPTVTPTPDPTATPTPISTPVPTPEVTPEPTATPTPVAIEPKFEKTKLYVNVGDKKKTNFDKADLSGKVTYKSSNKSVATVDSKGKITAKGVGTAKITATFKNKKYTCTVKVYDPKISGKSSVKKGKSTTLTIKNGRGTTKWSTSNKKIATVDSNGKVKGKKKGTVTITAVNNGKTIKKKITVK